MTRSPLPKDCPSCLRELYGVGRRRPEPGMGRRAMGLMALAGLISGTIYFCGVVYLRVFGGVPATWVAAAIVLPVALLPGLALAWFAYGLEKVHKLRCIGCSWQGQFACVRPGRCPSCDAKLRGKPGERCEKCGKVPYRAEAAPRGARVTPPDANASALHDMVKAEPTVPMDDGTSREEIASWLYREMATGETPESLSAKLIANGWDAAEVETLVENARKATRHLR